MAYRMLIVDDEPGILGLLKDYFSMLNYEVYTAMGGNDALGRIAVGPDIILLDVNMPDMDGFEVCRKIRAHVSCPIIFLTAKIEERDIINGLMLGGDDYILKPFGMEELEARVKAHLRREEREKRNGGVRICRDLAIYYDERMLYCKEQPVNLTRTEFNIVEMLSMHPSQVFDKEQIYEQIRGLDGTGDSTIITEHVRRIRAKIAKIGTGEYIETVWGVGYRWIG